MKFIYRSAFAFILTLAFLGKIEVLDAADVTIEKTILVRLVGDQFEPVESFVPNDTYGVLVFLSEGKPETRVKVNWMAVEAGGMKDKSIFEKEVVLTPEVIKSATDPTRIDFTLAHDNPYPTGAFKAVLYLNDVLAKTVEFKIESLTFTLDFCGTEQTDNPTEADLQKSVAALDTEKNDAFLVLGPSDLTYLQVSGDEKTGFVLEYQQGDIQHHYQANRNDLTTAEIVKAFLSYATGSDEWQKTYEWTQVEL
jgi:hypothetical protein